jgi:hypothetical protein
MEVAVAVAGLARHRLARILFDWDEESKCAPKAVGSAARRFRPPDIA